MKSNSKEYQVDILTLGDKETQYEFAIDNLFFQALEQQIVSKGNLKANVALQKSTTMIKATIDLLGKIELVCDRSLRDFMYPIAVHHTIYFKFGDKNEEISDDVVMIKEDTAVLNLAQYLFDCIGVEIPIKKIHPELITEKDNEEGDILIYSSVSNENELTDNNIDILDPRWEALKKLKDPF